MLLTAIGAWTADLGTQQKLEETGGAGCLGWCSICRERGDRRSESISSILDAGLDEGVEDVRTSDVFIV